MMVFIFYLKIAICPVTYLGGGIDRCLAIVTLHRFLFEITGGGSRPVVGVRLRSPAANGLGNLDQKFVLVPKRQEHEKLN